MSKTYAQLQKQIDSLTAEAEKLRRKEMEGVIERMKEAIDTYGLSAADLGLEAPGSRKAGSAARKAAGGKRKLSAALKFRDAAGNGWVGRGPRPQWLRDALASGKSLQDFAV
jgi:DNA-binding protein H-NS